MGIDACLQLVHRTPRRRRYRIRSATPVNWQRLEDDLALALPSLDLSWRINRQAFSITLLHHSRHDELVDGPQILETALRQGLQTLVHALEAAGATPPQPEVIEIRLHRRSTGRLQSLGVGNWSAVLNALSGSLSVVLLLLAAVLLLLGLIGLMLPLAPGAPLLVLGYVVIELAMALRRPFVSAPAP